MIEIGKPITKQQRELFDKILTIKDIVDISAESELSYSTFRELFYRKADITDTNISAVVDMIQGCFLKIEASISYFERAKRELEEMTPKVDSI